MPEIITVEAEKDIKTELLTLGFVMQKNDSNVTELK